MIFLDGKVKAQVRFQNLQNRILLKILNPTVSVFTTSVVELKQFFLAPDPIFRRVLDPDPDTT
jgi:hypothetical protein